MDWAKFNKYSLSYEKAFEILSNQLFELYCKKKYLDCIKKFVVINGSSGDGGIESYCELNDGNIIGIQAKWFRSALDSSNISQIRNSIKTAIGVRKNIIEYIVCIPRDLSNKKKGKNGKIIENNEYNKINNLFLEFNESGINFNFWGEYEIRQNLLKEEAIGIRNYWFNDLPLSFNDIKENFETAKESWLKNRYFEDLHVETNINFELNQLIGTNEVQNNQISELESIIEKCSELKNHVHQFLKMKIDNIKLIGDLEKLIVFLNDLIKKINNLLEIITLDNKIYFHCDYFDIYSILEQLEEKNYSYCYKSVTDKLINLLNNFDFYNIKNIIDKIINYHNLGILVVMGEMGMGKTHSLAYQINKCINSYKIPAIIIQASTISENSTWKEILEKAFGLPNTFSVKELWQILDSITWVYKTQNNNSKFLICIDGIDESQPYSKWQQIIDEALIISQKFSRIKFCFSGRYYAFKELNIKDKLIKRINSNIINGKMKYDMIKKYFDSYNVKTNDFVFFYEVLKNPLMIKLFCELYKGQTVSNSTKNITLTKIIKKTLENLDKDFVKKENLNSIYKDLIWRSCSIVSKYFETSESITYNNLMNLLFDNEYNQLSFEIKCNVIKSLSDYGIILETTRITSKIDPPEKIYYAGIQPIVEFLRANNIANKIIEKSTNGVKHVSQNILNLISLIVLEEKDTLIMNMKNVAKNFDNIELFEATCFSLRNIEKSATEKYKPMVLKNMKSDANTLRLIMNNIIIPVARINNHPLGPLLINEFLNNFSKPIDRDKIWSIPDYLYSDERKYYIQEELLINSENDNLFLDDNDTYCGLPLIYAWLLTSCENDKIYFYRNQLMQWSLARPFEFIKLFNLLADTNDMQMKEILMSIIMCLFFEDINDSAVSNEIINVLESRLYDADKKMIDIDLAIRYYLYSIFKKAKICNIISDEEYSMYVPKKDINKMLMIDKDKLNGSSFHGLNHIIYDWSRYVLCDPFYTLFSELDKKNELTNDNFSIFNYYNNDELEELLSCEKLDEKEKIKIEKHLKNIRKPSDFELMNLSDSVKKRKKKARKTVLDKFLSDILPFYGLNTNEVNFEQYILSCCNRFIFDLGLNEDDFNKNGIECLIRYHNYPATHGTKTKVMSFTEKYVWIFRNIFAEFIFNHVKTKNGNYFDRSFRWFCIPIEEINSSDLCDSNHLDDWLIMRGAINFDYNLGLKDWIIKNNDIDILKMILLKDKKEKEWVSIERFDSFIDKNNLKKVDLWISTGLVSNKDFDKLKDDINSNRSIIQNYFFDNSYFKESVDHDIYITPYEIINMPWRKRYYTKYKSTFISDGIIKFYDLFPTTIDGTYINTRYGDISYTTLSSKFQSVLNNTKYVNNKYYDDFNNIIAEYYRDNNNWDDCHDNLIVDLNSLKKGLKKEKYQVFWMIRIMKMPTFIASEIYSNINLRTDSYYVVFKEGNDFIIKSLEETNN